ncbi:3-methyladenine DNA glycosylase [Nesterenkonia sp. HG001]|uniref:3-methyladenine DNA glycosylase n=1 Tax=Nesterenkonia sp. HG001 TaxID=2983207 RepID=UPI002AC70956|nr:3-methyladenine DNA glycosylase [Nesterenkonia sp. HG001]MDZ5077724.1 3-methyladenine DNA glycosylase [Nesterenkonia sp. HG001]
MTTSATRTSASAPPPAPTSPGTPVGHRVLPTDEHRAAAEAHQRRVERYTSGFLGRRHAGKTHPVEDFLFTYYSHSPGQLSRWHPGVGAVLQGAGASEQAGWRFYTTVDDGSPEGAAGLDVVRFRRERDSMIGFARRLLGATAARPAQLGCFGLHEWAMVYRSVQHGQRHDQVPLRLGAEGTDEVVESLNIRCTHFDAYRFYTPSAKPLNTLSPTRESQVALEQPGCLHANMDLYKWAYKLIPAVGSELLMDCFDLAWRIRELDMRASPYDLADWGYAPVPIETPAGRAEYARAQRRFSEEAQLLRGRLLDVLDVVDALAEDA